MFAASWPEAPGGSTSMGGPRRKLLKPARRGQRRGDGPLDRVVRRLPAQRVPPGGQHGGRLPPRPAPILRLAGRTAACRSLTIQELADYAGWLHQHKLAPASIARHLASLRMFFRYLQLEGLLDRQPGRVVGQPEAVGARAARALARRWSSALFDSPQPGEPLWRRDRALLELLYATGCRASEISHLKLEDVHLDERLLPVPGQGGQGAARAAGAPGDRGRARLSGPRTASARGPSPPPPKWLLVSRRGLRLRRERIWELFKRYAAVRHRGRHEPAHAATQLRHAPACPAAPTCGKFKRC